MLPQLLSRENSRMGRESSHRWLELTHFDIRLRWVQCCAPETTQTVDALSLADLQVKHLNLFKDAAVFCEASNQLRSLVLLASTNPGPGIELCNLLPPQHLPGRRRGDHVVSAVCW